MPFGILEDRRLELVPGTALMRDQSDTPLDLQQLPTEQLKHGTGRYSHILLVPQPSDDPNDPLNWPTWYKDMILFIVSFSAALVGAYGPMLGPGFTVISRDLNISINTLSQSTAWLILTIGLSIFITNPLAKIYGKRLVYVLAILILLVVNIWGAATSDYQSFLGSRILGGVGMGPYEVLVQATIGDLYFVHQRATRIAVWNLFLLCGIAGASFISGYIIEDLGYRWTFGISATFFGVFVFLVVFLVPETAYTRPPPTALTSEKEKDQASDKARESDVHIESLSAPIPQRMSYARSLRLYTGRHTNAPLHKILLRPVVMFFYPAVLWAFLIYGTLITWIVVFSVVNGVLFVAPPYNFSISEAGLTGLSPFILTIIGEAISGPLNDAICVALTKRNRGVYEPEFRLVLMLVVVVLGAAGFFGFGASVDSATHWTGPVLTYGLANMSLAFASTCVFGYVLDSYPSLSEEAFVAINARNLLTFGLTYFVNDWLAKEGPLEVFAVLGACFVGVCLLTVPLWIWGKRARSWIARRAWLNEFMRDN